MCAALSAISTCYKVRRNACKRCTPQTAQHDSSHLTVCLSEAMLCLFWRPHQNLSVVIIAQNDRASSGACEQL